MPWTCVISDRIGEEIVVRKGIAKNKSKKD